MWQGPWYDVERPFRLYYTERWFRLSRNLGRRILSTTSSDHPGGATTTGRALRADARRNVQRVLRAAEEVFATEGIAVPVDVIAARAGVGVGTVYRHFPTKEALFKAVVVAHLESVLQRAKQLSTARDAGAAMFTFLREVVELAVAKKDLSDELARAGIDKEQLSSSVRGDLDRAFDTLLKRAQAEGVVRPDVTCADVTALVMGTCMAAGNQDKDGSRRLLTIVCDGLRAQPAPAVP